MKDLPKVPSPYVMAGVGFEPVTHHTQGAGTTEPPLLFTVDKVFWLRSLGQLAAILYHFVFCDLQIWNVKLTKDGKGELEFLSTLDRHTRTVNVVRFSPNG